MIYEWGVDPEVVGLLSHPAACSQLYSSFGQGTSRRVSRFPKSWARQAHEAARASGMSEIRLKAVEELLFKLNGEASVRTGRDYERDSTWSENARRQMAGDRPFRALLVAGQPDGPRVLTIDDVFTVPPVELWREERSVPVPRTPSDLLKITLPLVLISRKVVLVDPYAAPSKPTTVEYLRGLVHAAWSAPGADSFDLLVRSEKDVNDKFYGQLWMRALADVIPTGAMVRIWRLWQKRGGPRLHNRCLLTEVGGISLGNSVDGNDANDRDGAHIYDAPLYDAEWARYEDPGSNFNVEGSAPLIVKGTATAQLAENA